MRRLLSAFLLSALLLGATACEEKKSTVASNPTHPPGPAGDGAGGPPVKPKAAD